MHGGIGNMAIKWGDYQSEFQSLVAYWIQTQLEMKGNYKFWKMYVGLQ